MVRIAGMIFEADVEFNGDTIDITVSQELNLSY